MAFAKTHARMRGLGAALAALAIAAVAVLHDDAEAAEQDRTLRVGATYLPPARGNPLNGTGSPSIFTWSAMFDALTWVDETGTPTPALAENWRNIDPLTWRVRIKPDLVFSNGEPVDATAVTALIAWLLSDEGRAKGATVYDRMKVIERARTLDDLEVEFKTVAPDPILPARLAAMMLVAPKAWKDMGVEGYAQEPAGTGSYKIVSWSGERAVLTENETSWRPPIIKDLEVYEVPERTTRVQAFLSGQLDIAIGLSTENIEPLRAAGDTVDIVTSPQTLTLALVVHNAQPQWHSEPLQDKRVRQALNYAVDNVAMARHLLGDPELAASSSISPLAFGFNPELKPYPYDPERARQLLAEAGYPDGFELTFEVIPGAFPADNEIFQQAAADLNAVGVRTTLNQISFADYLKKFVPVTWDGNGFEGVWDIAPLMDAIAGFTNQSCLKSKPFFCTPELEERLAEISGEFDADRRKALLQELAAYYREEAPHVFLTYIVDITGVSKDITGFRNVARYMDYHKIRFVD